MVQRSRERRKKNVMKMNQIGKRKRNGLRILNLILPVVWDGKGRVSHFIDFHVCNVKCMPLKFGGTFLEKCT